MREVERRARLVEQLRVDGRASVAQLAAELDVTQSTIRRDLQRLDREGRVVRTYGGATMSGGVAASAGPIPRRDAKRRIARAAAALVADHATIAIGSGSTALELARAIADRQLTVITNALDVAGALLDREGIELIVLGGVVRPRMHSMLGHLAELATQELRADTLFMGIGAISIEQGLMNDSVPEILIDRALRRMARSVVVLADASKFELVAPGFVFSLDEVDVLVTDDAVAPATIAAVRERGVRVIVATEIPPGKERTMLEGLIPDEIREGPEAIRATLRAATPQARDVAARWRDLGIRRVHVIGNGTSYHSSLAAAALYRRHAGPLDPVVIPLTAADLRVYRPSLGAGDAIVGISSSGEFRDVVSVANEVRGTVPFAGIVHVAGSSLTGAASDIVLSAGGPSGVPVMTKTFSSTLVACELLLLELLGPERAAPIEAQIHDAADGAAAGIAAAEPLVVDLATSLRDIAHIFVVGGGLAYPAALEAALKLKEMALVHAEGTETWEMTSGAATMLGPGAVVIALAPAGPARAAMADMVSHAARWGARVIEVGPERLAESSDLLPLPLDAIEEQAPLTAVPPVALLAFALARIRGVDPDHPGWIERYHSQGLTHILGAGAATS